MQSLQDNNSKAFTGALTANTVSAQSVPVTQFQRNTVAKMSVIPTQAGKGTANTAHLTQRHAAPVMSMSSFGNNTTSFKAVQSSIFTPAMPVSMNTQQTMVPAQASANFVRRSQMSDIKMSASNMAASRQLTQSLFLNNARPTIQRRATQKVRAAPVMAASDAEEDPVFGKYKAELIETAKAIVAPGKGILAGDESNATIGKRFEALGIPSNHDMRQEYREMLFSAPGIEKHISGCIMFDETARDKCLDGKPFIQLLKERGIYSGIKVDTGVRNLGGTNDEFYTQGLDGL